MSESINMRLIIGASAVWFGMACPVWAGSTQPEFHVGDLFNISRNVEAAEKGPNGSTGSSTDRDTIVERVVGKSNSGIVLEYDLPKDTSAEDRNRQWQFPARVLLIQSGQMRLLDPEELAVRAEAWLRAAGLTSAACGHWVFTWNAFKIDCDPKSVIEAIKGFDLGPDYIAVGSSYRDPQALGPLIMKAKGEPTILYGETAIDPDSVRRAQAESDVVTAEVMRKPTTFESALKAHSAEEISGTISITFDIDAAGYPLRRVKLITVNIKEPDGRQEIRTVSQTLERRLVPQSNVP